MLPVSAALESLILRSPNTECLPNIFFISLLPAFEWYCLSTSDPFWKKKKCYIYICIYISIYISVSVYKLVSISYIYTCMLIHIAKSCPTLYDPTDCSPPGSSAHGIFPRQEYWSGLPFPSPGDLPDPGIEPVSPDSPALAGKLFTTEPPGKPMIVYLDLYLYIFIYTHKLNIQKTKIMASSPITSWEIDGETVETDFILGGLQNHCKWWLQPWS